MNKKGPRELDDVVIRLESIQRELARIEAAIIVREPTTPLAAESFEGLRRQVLASAKSSRPSRPARRIRHGRAQRRRHEDLELLVTRWLTQAGVTRVFEPVTPELFDIYGDSTGVLHVSSPAYVTDAGDGAVQVLQPGIVVRRAGRATNDRADDAEPVSAGAAEPAAVADAAPEAAPEATTEPPAPRNGAGDDPMPGASRSQPVAGDADDLVWSAHRRPKAAAERVRP